MHHEWMNVFPLQWTRFQTQNNRDQCFHSSVYQNHLGARVQRPTGLTPATLIQNFQGWVWESVFSQAPDECDDSECAGNREMNEMCSQLPAFQEEQGKLRSESADLASAEKLGLGGGSRTSSPAALPPPRQGRKKGQIFHS